MPTPTGTRYVATPRLGTPRIESPLRLDSSPGGGRGQFVPDGVWIRHTCEYHPTHVHDHDSCDDLLFEKAGPRREIYFEPSRTRAAVVTCGGLCPGLNSVIRSLFLELHFNYGVASVLGLRNGYRGLNPEFGPPIELTRDFVSEIHNEGGTMLGTSRGPQELSVMASAIEQLGIDVLFCIGGDGTQRGALELAGELARRDRRTAIVGVPKTIDNDLAHCDRTFGFLTAVEEAARVIHLAHTEARSTPRGIGLVKLMGRHSGAIACESVRACQQVNFVLIPEVPFALHGPGGFLEALERRIEERDHAVVVVAEGAGQYLFAGADSPHFDASGNKKLHDVGPKLHAEITEHFERKGARAVMKYFDPSYIIRSVPPTIEDQLLCDDLARRAAHAGMAGRTGLVVSLLNNAFVHVPTALTIDGKRQVDLSSDTWSSVLAATGQPARFGSR